MWESLGYDRSEGWGLGTDRHDPRRALIRYVCIFTCISGAHASANSQIKYAWAIDKVPNAVRGMQSSS